ncbi:MAG: hypothetical protein ACLUOS_06055 [Odoribacter splanchnicus]
MPCLKSGTSGQSSGSNNRRPDPIRLKAEDIQAGTHLGILEIKRSKNLQAILKTAVWAELETQNADIQLSIGAKVRYK